MAQLINNNGLLIDVDGNLHDVANLFSVEHQAMPYHEWGLNLSYIWNEGVVQIPIATTAAALPPLPITPPSTSTLSTNPPSTLSTPAQLAGGGSREVAGAVAGLFNPPACRIVREHAPCGQLVVRFKAERQHDWPMVPDPAPRSDNLRLREAVTVIDVPSLFPAGTDHVFAVSGVYSYFLVQPLHGPAGGLYAGVNPLSVTPFYFLSKGNFKPLV